MKLDNESFLLTTFNMPFGWYHFTRMPFEVYSRQKVFQKTTDMAFEGINGYISIVDDMLAVDHPKRIMTSICREFYSVRERLGSIGMLRSAL